MRSLQLKGPMPFLKKALRHLAWVDAATQAQPARDFLQVCLHQRVSPTRMAPRRGQRHTKEDRCHVEHGQAVPQSGFPRKRISSCAQAIPPPSDLPVYPLQSPASWFSNPLADIILPVPPDAHASTASITGKQRVPIVRFSACGHGHTIVGTQAANLPPQKWLESILSSASSQTETEP